LTILIKKVKVKVKVKIKVKVTLETGHEGPEGDL